MTNKELTARYNYSAFILEDVMPWLQFEQSPPLGQKAPDFPLHNLEDGTATALSAIWSQHLYTIVEFGSYT